MNAMSKTIGYAQTSNKRIMVNSLEKLENMNCDLICIDYDGDDSGFKKMINSIDKGDTVILTNVFEINKMTRKIIEIIEALEAKKGSLYIEGEEMYNSNKINASAKKNIAIVLAGMIGTVRDYKKKYPEFKSEQPSKIISKILEGESINNVMAIMMTECGIQILKSIEK